MDQIESAMQTIREPTFVDRVKEQAELFLLNFVVRGRNIAEQCRVTWRYYSNLRFAKADLLLLSQYFTKSAFRYSKEFLLAKGEEEIYSYGETPLTTLEQIAEKADVTAADTLFALGCGRAP